MSWSLLTVCVLVLLQFMSLIHGFKIQPESLRSFGPEKYQIVYDMIKHQRLEDESRMIQDFLPDSQSLIYFLNTMHWYFKIGNMREVDDISSSIEPISSTDAENSELLSYCFSNQTTDLVTVSNLYWSDDNISKSISDLLNCLNHVHHSITKRDQNLYQVILEASASLKNINRIHFHRDLTHKFLISGCLIFVAIGFFV